MIINKLFWQKYRPKNFDAMILLPRIKEQLFDKDDNLIINNNLLFTGGPGLGKSSLAELIIPKSSLKINASYSSSVEDLKEDVTNYCRQVGTSIFDDDYDPEKQSKFKFVYLNEADGLSQKYQEALKAFIEEHADRIRFIATCNNLIKLSPELRSRFTVIDFDPKTEEERNYLIEEYLERAKLVVEKNAIEIEDKDIKDLIELNFPDLRSTLNNLQELVGKKKKDKPELSNNLDFFNLIFEKIEPNKTYEWVISNYGDRVEPLLKLCGRYLAEYIMHQKQEKIVCLPKILPIVTDYSNKLPNAIDPVILAISCIYDIQTIIHK